MSPSARLWPGLACSPSLTRDRGQAEVRGRCLRFESLAARACVRRRGGGCQGEDERRREDAGRRGSGEERVEGVLDVVLARRWPMHARRGGRGQPQSKSEGGSGAASAAPANGGQAFHLLRRPTLSSFSAHRRNLFTTSRR